MSSYSSYPPGVSGNEFQIAGYPERTVKKICGAECGDLHVVDPWIVQRAAELLNEIDFDAVKGRDYSTEVTLSNYRARNIYHLLLDAARQTFTAESDCPFEGDVDTQYDYNAEWWECPICGTEHEDSIDDWRG